MRSITYSDRIRAVPETAIQEYLCTRPAARFLLDLHVERPAGIGPCIFRIVGVVRASLVTGNHANTPIVAAECERSSRGQLWRANALHNCYERDGTALGRSYIRRG